MERASLHLYDIALMAQAPAPASVVPDRWGQLRAGPHV